MAVQVYCGCGYETKIYEDINNANQELQLCGGKFNIFPWESSKCPKCKKNNTLKVRGLFKRE